MRPYAALLPLLALAIAAAIGCTSQSQPPAAMPTSCPPPGCVTEPYRADEPQNAISSTPDPERDAMTRQMRLQLTDRMTDYIYTAAALDLTIDRPAAMPNHLADRNHHDDCLYRTRQTLYEYTDPAQPERPDPTTFYQQQIDRFRNCLAERTDHWSQHPIADRSIWLRHILAAAARTNDPSEYHRHLLHNEQTDPGWQALHEDFRQCQELAAPVSDAIAVVAEPTAVSAQVRQAIADIADCSSRLTQIRYPETPKDSTAPSPPLTPPPPDVSTPSAPDSGSPPASWP